MPGSGETLPAGRRQDDDGAAPGAVVVSVRPRQPWWQPALAVVLGGLLAAVLGTALHGHIWYVGGLALPVGALAAVVLLTSVSVFIGVSARNVFLAACTGAFSYALVGLSVMLGTGQLVAAGIQVEGVTPPVAVAGYVWVVGIAVGTVTAVALTWLVLRGSPGRRPAG